MRSCFFEKLSRVLASIFVFSLQSFSPSVSMGFSSNQLSVFFVEGVSDWLQYDQVFARINCSLLIDYLSFLHMAFKRVYCIILSSHPTEQRFVCDTVYVCNHRLL